MALVTVAQAVEERCVHFSEYLSRDGRDVLDLHGLSDKGGGRSALVCGVTASLPAPASRAHINSEASVRNAIW